jgi:hypothetical protein
VLNVKRLFPITPLLLLLNSLVVCQTPSPGPDCSTLKYVPHEVSCLCGTVQVYSGDMCSNSPQFFGFDDDITVELRDKAGTKVLDSTKAPVVITDKEGKAQDGTKAPFKSVDRTFCFEGHPDGDYVLAFVLHKDGLPQPAVKFPTNYSHTRRKACDSVYMVEPSCP